MISKHSSINSYYLYYYYGVITIQILLDNGTIYCSYRLFFAQTIPLYCEGKNFTFTTKRMLTTGKVFFLAFNIELLRKSDEDRQ